MEPQHHTIADPLIGLRALLDSVSSQEAALLANIATSAASQALALRQLPKPESQESVSSEYVPHALDVLIVGAIRLDGAQIGPQLVAALEGDQYQTQGEKRTATEATIKRRINYLVKVGLLRSTRSGYVIDDEQLAESLEKIDFG